jgi:hypothetical protein
MTTFWIVRHRESGEEQFPQCESDEPPYDPEIFDIAELPRELDGAAERWDWEAGEIVCRFTPAEAAEIMWERSKAYCAERQIAPLPIAGIIENDVLVAERDEDGQKWIDRFTGLATAALVAQQPFSISFTDGTNRYFTIDATQIIRLAAASCAQQSLCHGRSQLVRAAIAAALAAGGTADGIFAIDITEGYPDPNEPVSAPPPPQEES